MSPSQYHQLVTQLRSSGEVWLTVLALDLTRLQLLGLWLWNSQQDVLSFWILFLLWFNLLACFKRGFHYLSQTGSEVSHSLYWTGIDYLLSSGSWVLGLQMWVITPSSIKLFWGFKHGNLNNKVFSKHVIKWFYSYWVLTGGCGIMGQLDSWFGIR